MDTLEYISPIFLPPAFLSGSPLGAAVAKTVLATQLLSKAKHTLEHLASSLNACQFALIFLGFYGPIPIPSLTPLLALPVHLAHGRVE